MAQISDEAGLAAAIAHQARASRRLRLEIAALRHNPQLARALEASASRRPGVTRASASVRSGRLLIEYEADAPVLDELEQLATLPRRLRGRRSRATPESTFAVPAASWHAEPVEHV